MQYFWALIVLFSPAGASAQPLQETAAPALAGLGDAARLRAERDLAAAPVAQNEELFYRAEWRLIHAGNARLTWTPADGNSGFETRLKLESVGLVSMLHKVSNEYTSALDEKLCATSSLLKTNEGRKQRETAVTFDQEQKKASYLERDTAKNTVVDSHEIDIPGCVHDVIAALYRLRSMRLQPGESALIPISDGKKSVQARVEAQEREKIKIGGMTYQTTRYEAFLFNNVLYRRPGRLFIWLTDDERRLPVQLRVRLPFYIGTVTLQLSGYPPRPGAARSGGADSDESKRSSRLPESSGKKKS